MPDAKAPAAPARAPINKSFGVAGVSVLAIATAAAMLQAPVTARHEGEKLRAYLDPAKVATICSGRTKGVTLGMTATHAQCQAWLKDELTAHTLAALTAVPALAEQQGALRQAGDFAFNAGDPRFAASPMAVQFRLRHWRQGCEAFRGYVTLARATRVEPGYRYVRNKQGKLYRELPGLVSRREDERARCLASLPA
jgi:GH24 family phage-related lysozyme (muramidase)